MNPSVAEREGTPVHSCPHCEAAEKRIAALEREKVELKWAMDVMHAREDEFHRAMLDYAVKIERNKP